MATEAVIIQEPVSMVEKMATEAVIIQEPISIVEKIAAEAVILAEPISLVKKEEEGKHLPLGVSAGDNGAETTSIITEGNLEISKGESFLISPEISMVANEPCEMSEHIEVDGTAYKAEKIPEDEEKAVIWIEENDGTREGIEKGDINDGGGQIKEQSSRDSQGPIVESLKEADQTVSEASNSDRVKEINSIESEKLPAEMGMDRVILDSNGDTLVETVAESKEIACTHEPEVDEKLEEVSSEEIKCIKEENDGTQNENLSNTSSVTKTEELHSQASSIETENAFEERPAEETGLSEIDEKTDQDFGKSGELRKDYANSELENVVVDMIQVAYKEPAMTGASDEMKRDEKSAVAAPEGYIIEAEHVSILNEKPASPMNVVCEDVDAAISGETAEATKNIKDATSSIGTTEHEGIGVAGANIDVNSMDSFVKCEKNVEILGPRKEDGMQDEIPNAGSEDQVEITTKEIPLKEALVDEVKEHSTVPSEEYETIEERKIADETSEKYQGPYENLEKVVDVKLVPETDVELAVTNEEPTVSVPDGNIIEAENIDSVLQSQEEKSKEEIPESFQQKNEPEKEKPACPLNVVSEDVDTYISGETEETSTSIEEATSIEERHVGEGREDSATHHLQIEENENKEIEVEITNQNADDLQVTDSSVGQPATNEHEKQFEFSDVHETIGASKEKREDSEDVSEACSDSTNPEHISTEAAATTNLKSETSEMDNEKPMFVQEVHLLDTEECSESNKALENKQDGIQPDLEECTAEKLELKDGVENLVDNSKREETKEIGEKLELDNTMENAEKRILDDEDTNKDPTTVKEVFKGSETAVSGTEKDEIKPIAAEEELVRSSSFEHKDSKKDTDDETTVQASIDPADLDCTSQAAETKETNLKEAKAEAEEEKNEINNVVDRKDDVKSEDIEIPQEEDGMQDNPSCPLDVVHEDVNTAISSENAETTSTSIGEATSHEERFEGEGKEDSPTEHLQIKVNENDGAVEVEISNENADDLQVTNSSVRQPAENEQEKQLEISDVQRVEIEALEHKEEGILQELEDCRAEKPEEKDVMESMKDNLKVEETEKVREGPKSIIKEECAIIDESLKSTETIKEENTVAVMSITEASSNSIFEEVDSIEETANSSNNPSLFDGAKESKDEITPIQVKEEHVHSSSFDLEETRNFTEEEISVAETENTNIKEAEIDAKSVDSHVTCEDMEIPKEEDAMQDTVLNARSGDQSEMTTEEIPLKEVSGDEVKEYEATLPEERKLSDETSAKNQSQYEHSETPLSQATNEKLVQNDADNQQIDAPKAEPEDTGNQIGHEVEEQLAEEPNVEVTNVFTGEEHRELEHQTNDSEAKTMQDEKSSDLGRKKEKIEDGKPLDEATDLGETLGTYKDDEKAIEEENPAKNLEKPESLKEDTEIEKEDQIPEIVVEYIEDNLKVEETEEIQEGSKSIIKEECGIIDDSQKSTETMEEESKEEKTVAKVSTTEASSNSIIEEVDSIEETAKSSNDPSQFDVAKESKEEITPIEVKEDHVHSSSFELQESRNFTEEAISVAETEETNIKEAEIDVKSVDSCVTREDTEIPKEEDAMQDTVLNARNGDQSEMTTEEIPLKEVSGDEVKEYEATNISTGEEQRELENQTDASEAKTVQDEKSSDLGWEREKIEDGKPLDEATDLVETLGPCKDDEKAIEEENPAKNLEKPESLKEDTEIEKDQIPEIVTMNDNAKAEDSSSVSTKCLKEAESEEQIVAENLVVEEHSTNNGEVSHVIVKLEEMKQDEESEDPVSVHGEDREAEEKTEEIIKGSRLCHDESCIEAVTEVSAETSIQDTNKIVNASNISSVETSLENIESNANQETGVENVQLEEISSEMDRDLRTNDNDEVQKKNETVDKDEAEVIKRVPDAFYVLEVQVADTEKSLIAETGDELNRDHELVETKSEASKTANADELGKIDDIGSPNTVLEVKPEELTPTSACALLSEYEEIGTANPVEKIEEETQKDAEIENESREDFSETKTIEEVCSSNEEQREIRAVSEEETIPDLGPLNDGPEEKIQTLSSILPSEESKRGTRSISEEIEYGTTKEEVPTKLGDEVTGEQTLSDDKPEEGTTSTPLVSEEDREENIHTVEKTEDEKTYEADMIPDKISEDISVMETTAEICLENAELLELDDGKKNDAENEDEKTKEAGIIRDAIEEDAKDANTESEICSQTERSIELEAVAEDEMAAGETLTQKISYEEVQNPTSALPSKEEECESTITAETTILLSEVQGDERKETELIEEDESHENIPEQTREIEEASGFNTEIHEKAFENELLDEKEDAAIQEKLVKEGTETGEIMLNEISKEKVIIEAQKTTENENSIEDKVVEDPSQTSVERTETTAVTEENIELAIAGFEVKHESDSETVGEDRSKETITEDTQSHHHETSIDVENQETEEQIKEELKDKPEADNSIHAEEIANEVTKAVILSDVVDMDVEEVGIENIKEQVMEKESSTNELQPISKGDEATDKVISVEDYTAVSTERFEEAESEEKRKAENSEVKEIEEIMDDLKLSPEESHNEAVTEERAETSLNDELVNASNISSVKMNLESTESDANQETKEVQKVQLEDISSDLAPEVPANNNDEVEVIKKDTDSFYMPKDQIAEAENGPQAELEADKVEETEGVPESSSDNISQRFETILKDDISSTDTLLEKKPEGQLQSSACTMLSGDEEIQKDTEIKHEILEDSSHTKTVEKVCLPNEEQRELKPVSEEEIIADEGLPNDEPEEQIQTSLTLPSKEIKDTNGATSDEIEYGKTSEEASIKLDVVTGDEITGEQTIETNKPEEIASSPLITLEEQNVSSVEKVEEEKLSEADIPDKISEDSSDAKRTTETCSAKDEFQELDDVKKDGTAAAQALQVEESNERSLPSELPIENPENGAEANEEEEAEKVKEEEMLEKDGPREPEAVVHQETIIEQASIAEESQEIETIVIVEKLDEEKTEGDTKDETTLLTETMKEESKKHNTTTMVSLTEASNSIIEETDSLEETAKSNNDPSLFDVEKESKKEITPIEEKADHVHSSSLDLEESRNFTEEGIPVAETEETNIKEAEAEAEEEKNEIKEVVSVEEISVAKTEHEEISVCNAEIDVKSVDSDVTPVKDMEIVEEEDAMQDKDPNARSGDQLEMTTKEIPLKEISGDEAEEYEATLFEERKICGETSEKDQAPYEHPESQATDEKVMQNDDSQQLDIPKAEPQDTGNEIGHKVEEQLAEEPKVEVHNVSTGEEHGALENQTDACEVKTVQDEKSSDLGREREEIEDGKPLAEATDLGEEPLDSCKDNEKAIKEENLAKNLEQPESLKEDTDIEKGDQIAEMIIMNDNAKVEDYSSVSTERLKEDESEEQIVAENLEVEEHSTNDGGASHVMKELEEKRQDEESRDPVSVHSEDREAEEKTEEIIEDSKLCYEERCVEAVTEASAKTNLDDTDKIVSASNISSVETSLENIESDADQETQVENVQLEEISSELDPDARTNDNDENGEDPALQQEPLKEDEALAVHGIYKTEKPEEQIQTPAITAPSEEHKNETIDDVYITGEIKDGDSDGVKTAEEKTTEKDETMEPAAKPEGEMNSSPIIAEESEEHGALIEEAESLEDEKLSQSECTRELQVALEDGETAVHTAPGETSVDNLHTTTTGNETKEIEQQEDESPEKIQEKTREIEEASNFNKEKCEKAFGNESLTETENDPNVDEIVIARDETRGEENRCEKRNEGNEITVNEVSNEEVMEDKEVTEKSYSTSHLEEIIKEERGEDEPKDKLIEDNTYEENVEPAPPGFEENPESDSEPLAEDQSKEAFTEHTKSLDDETSSDVRNQETEEQIKEELKDKLEAEDGINGEQNKNEVTKVVILSEEMENYSSVSTECIKEAEYKEQVEAENSQVEENTISDHVNVQSEDSKAEEVEIIDDLKLGHDKSHIEAVTEVRAETRLNDTEVNEEPANTSNISSVARSLETIEHDVNQETKEVEKVQLEEISSNLAPEVPSNDNDEAEVIKRDLEAFCMPKDQIAENAPTAELGADKVEEIEGETETSADDISQRVETILKDDISSTNTSPEEAPDEQPQSSACTFLSEDEQIRIANPDEKIEEEIQSTAEIIHESREESSETKAVEVSCVPSEEQRELKAISVEETIADQGLPVDEPEEKIETISCVSTLPSDESEQASGAKSQEITNEQILATNEPEERTTSSPLVSKEKEEEIICMVEKTEEEESNVADMILNKTSEISSDAKKTAETGSEKEAFKELDYAKKDETGATQAFQVEESNEQSLTSELTVENIKHGAMAIDEEEEEVKEVEMRENDEMCLEKEVPQEVEAVVDQETIVAQAPIREESQEIEVICIVEKQDEEKTKDDEKLDDENCEGSSPGEIEELNKLHLFTKEEITSSQTFSEKQLHISTSTTTSEEQEHGTAETQDEQTSVGEITKDEIVENPSDASTTVEICSQKERSVELEAVAKDEMAAGIVEKIGREKIEAAESLQDDNCEDVTMHKELHLEDEALAIENSTSSQTIPTEKSEEQIPNPVVKFPSEEQKLETINEVDRTVEEISTKKDEIKVVEPVLEGGTNHLHITTSALPSEVPGDETNESESKDDESPEKILEQTGEIQEASNFKTDTCDNAFDNELLYETEDGAIKENLVKVIDGSEGEENQCEKTNEGNEITLNEVTTEKIMKNNEVTETSCSTSCSEELVKDGSGEDENVEPELQGCEEKLNSDSEPVAEDQSKDSIPEDTKNQDYETRNNLRDQETGEQIKEELIDKVKDGDDINSEENDNEVTKAVILSEKVVEEVEKVDGSEDMKEHVMEKESSTNELHPVLRGNEANDEVEDYSAVPIECIEEAESEQQKGAENLVVGENSPNVKEGSNVTKELEVGIQGEKSRDPVNVHDDREAEEKVEIINDLNLGHDESHTEAVIEVREDTSLNNAEVYEEPVNTSNISSVKMSLETIESVANQETKEVEKVQLDEISSNMVPEAPVSGNDEVVVIKKDTDVSCMHNDQVAEAENGSTAEQEANKVDETERAPETSPDYISQSETVLINDISPTNTLPEEKSDEKLQSSAWTLLSEDEIRIANPVEKIGEEVQNDARIKHESQEDSSDTKTMEEVCLPSEEQRELKAVLEEETTADKALPNDEPEEQIQTTTSTFPSEEMEHASGGISEEIEYGQTKEEADTKLDVVEENEITGEKDLETNKPKECTSSSSMVSMEDEEIVSSVEKMEEEKINEVDIQNQISKDFSVVEKTPKFQELDDAKKEETTAAQVLQVEESNEQSFISELPAENLKDGAEANEEEEKVEEVEMLKKEGHREPEAIVDQETSVSQDSITDESQKIEAMGILDKLDEEKRKEAEKLGNENCEDSSAGETGELNELHIVTKEEIASSQTFSEEQIHISASAISCEEMKRETEPEDEKLSEWEIIKGETEEDALEARKTIEICSQKEGSIKLEAVVENETTAGTSEKIESEKTEEAEFLNVTQSKDDENPEKFREQTGEIELLNETKDVAIKENIVKARDGSGCDENHCEKTDKGNQITLNEASTEKVTSYSTPCLEEPSKDGLGEDALKDELIEDNTDEELIGEAQKTSENEIIEKQIEDGVVEDRGLTSVVIIETIMESSTELSAAESNQILDDIQQTERTTKASSDMQIPRGLDLIENTGTTGSVAKEHVSIDFQDTVVISSEKVEDTKEIYPGIVECGGEKTSEKVAEESILVEDSTKLSLDRVESFTNETLQVTRGIIDAEAKAETNVSQILLEEKLEKKSPTPVDAVEEKEVKEVETRDKGYSDTETGGKICSEKEENKEPEAVVEQENIVIEAPQTKIKEDPVSHSDDGIKEDEHTGNKTNETLKIRTDEHQNEKLSAETITDRAIDNIEKETVAEDGTVKDDMNAGTIVREEIPGKEHPSVCKTTTNSTGDERFPTEQRHQAFEATDKTEVGDFEAGNAREICLEAEIEDGKEKRPDNLGAEKPEVPESADSSKLSLHDLLQRSTRETIHGTKTVIEDRELIVSNEQAPEEEAKTDEEEGNEHSKTESGTKPHKKSHKLLSGVGSKVKQSISKVKKAITGKSSSHSKEPKPISPKESKK